MSLPPDVAEPVVARLRAALEPWRGTEFADGQSVCGAGAHCAGFVVAVAAELQGVEDVPPVAAIGRDRLTSRTHRREEFARMRRDFGYVEETTTDDLQPGDVCVWGGRGTGIRHLAIVAPDPGFAWDVVRGGKVGPTTLAMCAPGLQFMAAVRTPDRVGWGA